jgi:hypothetical protein
MIVSKKFGIVHVHAECKDCDWSTNSHKNGQAIAAIHAEKHKHKVVVDVRMTGFYNGRTTSETVQKRGLFDDA